MAFYGIEPWGESRADLRTAQLIAIQCKDPPPLADLVLFPDDRFDEPESEDEQWARWDATLERAAARSKRTKGD